MAPGVNWPESELELRALPRIGRRRGATRQQQRQHESQNSTCARKVTVSEPSVAGPPEAERASAF